MANSRRVTFNLFLLSIQTGTYQLAALPARTGFSQSICFKRAPLPAEQIF